MIFNDIIAKHINNINEKRDLLSQERTKTRELEERVEKLDKDLTEFAGYSGKYYEVKNANKLAHERIKELESTDHFNAAQTYQKELVKAERENKILANELLAIINETGTKARPKISISHDGKNAHYVIDRFVDFDHPHTIDILAKHEARIDKEQEEDQWN